MNTLDFLTIASSVVPDRTAISFEGQEYSYAQVNERSNRLAHALLDLGVKTGDRVAILQVNCPQYLEAYYGAVKAGAIFVPLNFRAKEDELTYLLNHSESQVLLVGERYLDLANSLRRHAPGVRHYISLEKPHSGMLDYETLLQRASPEDLFPEIGDDDATILLYTAGTTGRPKGVPLTHRSFGTYVQENVEPPDLEKTETNIITVPLYHVAGTQAMLAAIYGGGAPRPIGALWGR